MTVCSNSMNSFSDKSWHYDSVGEIEFVVFCAEPYHEIYHPTKGLVLACIICAPCCRARQAGRQTNGYLKSAQANETGDNMAWHSRRCPRLPLIRADFHGPSGAGLCRLECKLQLWLIADYTDTYMHGNVIEGRYEKYVPGNWKNVLPYLECQTVFVSGDWVKAVVWYCVRGI